MFRALGTPACCLLSWPRCIQSRCACSSAQSTAGHGQGLDKGWTPELELKAMHLLICSGHGVQSAYVGIQELAVRSLCEGIERKAQSNRNREMAAGTLGQRTRELHRTTELPKCAKLRPRRGHLLEPGRPGIVPH